MDELGPKSRLSWTAAASFWFALAGVTCLVLSFVLREPNYLSGALIGVSLGILLGVLSQIDIGRSEGRLRGAGRANWAIFGGGFLFAVGLCSPAIQSSQGSDRRSQSVSRFRQIGLALLSYHDAFGRFPPAAVVDREGRPMYSWRVLLLPYLDDPHLYTRFHLDEPWDSPHNWPFLAEIPDAYRMIHRGDDRPEKGLTFVQVFLGKGTAFDSSQGEPLRFPDGTPNFPDGVDRTLFAVEAGMAVPWTRPVDLPFMADAQLPPLGGVFSPLFGPGTPSADYLSLFGDGSVRHLKRRQVTERTLRALITRNGREPLDPVSDY